MEEKNVLNGSGFTINGDAVPQSFKFEPRIENTGPKNGGSTAPPTHSAPVSVVAAPHKSEIKKKRGRPRKFAADGSIVALSPMPISASIPFTSDYSSWKPSFKKKNQLELGSSERMPYSGGGGFTPHMLIVTPGEDIMMKIISFSQQGDRAICILAATGSISNVTLRQPNSSCGTLTYEGRFEILSLTGSFMPSDNGVTKGRSGGMSVSLAGPDGRVMGGGLAGMLVAAGPVQIIIGSFIPGEQEEQKPKKQKHEHTISFAAPNTTTDIVSEERFEPIYSVTKPNLTFSAPINPGHGFTTTLPEKNASSLPQQASMEQNHEMAF